MALSSCEARLARVYLARVKPIVRLGPLAHAGSLKFICTMVDQELSSSIYNMPQVSKTELSKTSCTSSDSSPMIPDCKVRELKRSHGCFNCQRVASVVWLEICQSLMIVDALYGDSNLIMVK